MIYKEFYKTFKKILIDENMTLKEAAQKIGESQQNLNGKLSRETIRLMDVEKALDIAGYKLVICKKTNK